MENQRLVDIIENARDKKRRLLVTAAKHLNGFIINFE